MRSHISVCLYSKLTSTTLKAKFQAQFVGYRDEQSITFCTVEMVDACIRQLKRGKAAGHDQLTVEHLRILMVIKQAPITTGG